MNNKKNKGGRPRSDDARYKGKIISLRLDPIGERILDRLVKNSGKKSSEVIRELITEG